MSKIEYFSINRLMSEIESSYKEFLKSVYSVKSKFEDVLLGQVEFMGDLALIEFFIDYAENLAYIKLEPIKQDLEMICEKIRDLKYKEIKLKKLKEYYGKRSDLNEEK